MLLFDGAWSPSGGGGYHRHSQNKIKMFRDNYPNEGGSNLINYTENFLYLIDISRVTIIKSNSSKDCLLSRRGTQLFLSKIKYLSLPF